MRRTTIAVLAGIAAATFVLAGGDEPVAVPVGLGTPDPLRVPWPDEEAASAAQIDLGRHLFFDPRLSLDRTTSCATCHDPDLGLADGRVRSIGHAGFTLSRNTPGLANIAYGTVFFWDGRAASLEEQAIGPMTNTQEMALPRDQIVPRLTAYRQRFAEAYPTGGLTVEHALHAIASFERTLISRRSDFDRYAAGDRTALSKEAQRGMAIFAAEGCIECHRGPNLTNESFQDVGLADVTDPGRTAIVAGVTLRHAFKTPSLRNVALTAPYFHDGSAPTLEAVIDFYNRGGDRHGVNPLIMPLGLDAQDQADLVAFLRALTDPIHVERPTLPPDP